MKSIRNVAIEKTAQHYLWPCHFASAGCPEMLQYDKASEHLKACSFRPFQCCPMEGCQAEMTVDGRAVVDHLVSVHGLKMDDRFARRLRQRKSVCERFELPLNAFSGSQDDRVTFEPVLFKHDNRYFMLRGGGESAGRNNGQYFFGVIGIGREHDFEGLHYKLVCQQENALSGRQPNALAFSGSVQSIETWRKNGAGGGLPMDGLGIGSSAALRFGNSNPLSQSPPVLTLRLTIGPSSSTTLLSPIDEEKEGLVVRKMKVEKSFVLIDDDGGDESESASDDNESDDGGNESESDESDDSSDSSTSDDESDDSGESQDEHEDGRARAGPQRVIRRRR